MNVTSPSITNSTAPQQAHGWLEDTAQTLGFSSSSTFAISMVLLFLSLLAMGLFIVLLLTAICKRLCSRDSFTTWPVFVIAQRRRCSTRVLLNPDQGPPSYDQCLDISSGSKDVQIYWWDEGSYGSGTLSSTPPPSYSTLEQILTTTHK